MKITGKIVKIMPALTFARPFESSIREGQVTLILALIEPDLTSKEKFGRLAEKVIDGMLYGAILLDVHSGKSGIGMALRLQMSNSGDMVSFFISGYQSKDLPEYIIEITDFKNLSQPYLNKL